MPLQLIRSNQAGLDPLVALTHIGMWGMHVASAVRSQARLILTYNTCGSHVGCLLCKLVSTIFAVIGVRFCFCEMDSLYVDYG